jgi:hypothetical protein
MFRDIIKTGTPGRMESLGGMPALVIDPGVAGSNPGSVQFVAKNQLVELVGDTSGTIDSNALWAAATSALGAGDPSAVGV